MKKRLVAGAAMGAAIMAGSLLAATPANAAWAFCNPGYLCAYYDSNGNGPNFAGQYDNPSWNGSWGYYNNVTSSLWNNGTMSNVNVYVNMNYSGANFTVYRGTTKRHTDLFWDTTGGRPAGYWNDNLESNLWL
ncbi:hypothetical protein GCM10009860_13540 [Microbacterium mitrae]|uniref:Peptidase inhibitor family I36 protein n=1 Tax=Microbacterium mitrae TaxID=664640 RepID=A0A5C8HKK5_9MICO|nr:peptidase inhibitor family I36 protein [Microbacterium mitrae]TXK03540.1 hypothetical protein FVP60_11765 [Microbacterium mitrae]